ncbi:DBF zinc finger domain protein [Aspergillus avenaceus]|uniref:DBF zinc finger domain protein n=1 Tax=Aspergillus avenaceus TaxID=36643 RepID=A0A5N6TYB4_ASPAV|nr:DBF zinc finger domain protein [Aspergillus avenaceus]
MAAVFIPPSPQTSFNMTTRRPLANVPNATNSPHRAGLVPAKRPRTANAPIDIPYGQPPPKKQVVDGTEYESRSPARSRPATFQNPDSRLFARRSTNAQPSAFERKLVAARDRERQTQQRGARHERPSTETLDSIRQWQRHYRKAFPQFVFYFDSVPEDLRSKCSRQVIALGAREEKFFSRVVTHVVTLRPIPPETDAVSPAEVNAESVDQSAADGTLQTVNPSLLEKTPDMHLQMSLKNDARREQSNMDVLHRARQMGMKIWAIEKLQRMIATINDGEIGGHGSHTTRNNHVGGGHSRVRGEADLSQVLQNELNGSTDRNPFSVMKDLVMFKGPFIYIHDMDEKTRPVMVREYPKVMRRQDGIWPQFRSAPLGKCPFIDEPPTKKDMERHRARQQEKEKKTVSKPVPAFETHVPRANVPEYTIEKANDRMSIEENTPQDSYDAVPYRKQPELQKMQPTRPPSPRKSSESFVPPQINCGGRFYTGREPAASGVQPSNITSAIRSQMVSSTAAAPGAKAGVSKEVHELKRKVLEKGNGGLSTSKGTFPHGPFDLDAVFKMTKNYMSRGKWGPADRHGDAAATEEESTQPESNDAAKRAGNVRKGVCPKKKERRRDPKPGYCENCRDKFDDFEEHVMTRKHRKFATNGGNWAELDSLLKQLKRPLKDEYN